MMGPRCACKAWHMTYLVNLLRKGILHMIQHKLLMPRGCPPPCPCSVYVSAQGDSVVSGAYDCTSQEEVALSSAGSVSLEDFLTCLRVCIPATHERVCCSRSI